MIIRYTTPPVACLIFTIQFCDEWDMCNWSSHSVVSVMCGCCSFNSYYALVCMQVDSEEPVFEAVLNWVKHNRKEREPYLPDMLEFVRMPLLTPRYITDVIDAEVSQATHQKEYILRYLPLLPLQLTKYILTCSSHSFGVACHVETLWMRPRNST